MPQLVAPQSVFAATAGLMRHRIDQAEQSATAAQASHVGQSAAAFQSAHARFVAAAAQVNALLDIAQANLGDAAGTYVAADGARPGRSRHVGWLAQLVPD
nr:WXG100 family type VII secretion target [Mycobacterium attenuatum]